MKLTRSNPKSHFAVLWKALQCYRDDCISTDDEEWDDICTVMEWIKEDSFLSEMSDYEIVNQLGKELSSFRDEHDDSLIISFGSREALPQAKDGLLTVTIAKKGVTATSEALRLGDAVLLARGKVNRILQKLQEEKEKGS